MSEERRCISDGYWAAYERVDGSDDAWEFLGMANADDPKSAALQATVRKWNGGHHFVLVAGVTGAYEYDIKLESSGPVV